MSTAGPNATADKTTVATHHIEQTQTHCACNATELHKPETYLKLSLSSALVRLRDGIFARCIAAAYLGFQLCSLYSRKPHATTVNTSWSQLLQHLHRFLFCTHVQSIAIEAHQTYVIALLRRIISSMRAQKSGTSFIVQLSTSRSSRRAGGG